LIHSTLSTNAHVKLRWDLTKEDVIAMAEAAIVRSRDTQDGIVRAVEEGNTAWGATFGKLAEDEAFQYVMDSVCTFPQHASTDKELRDAATEADKKLSAYDVEAGSRKDVYQALAKTAASLQTSELSPEQHRLVERILRDFRRQGLDLGEKEAARVKAINERISELGIAFSKNLGEEKSKHPFTAEELEGCPEDWLKKLERDGDKYLVTLKYPDYFPVMEQCCVAETRRRMEFEFNSRCSAENSKILEELVELRHEKAGLLGYDTHSAFIVEARMSKTEPAVRDFLSNLASKLDPLMKSDMATLLEIKKAECEKRCEPFDGKINAWDQRRCAHVLKKDRYQVDHEKLKEYFPMEVVTKGLLGIYQELLGLVFTPDGTLQKWHDDVQTFAVTDAETQEPVGWFYMDMHPREGKYGHAACFGLQPGCEAPWAPSGYQLPVAAIVCNFPAPSPDKPALLEHGDVETYFHEFGHLMHQMCARAKFSKFAGTAVERDFVEAPSQMLENWVWEAEALDRMSAHYKTGEKIPRDLLQALIASRNVNEGLLNKRQVVLATFDQTIHTAEKVNTAEVLKDTNVKMGFPFTDGTNMAASFGHLAGGYDAQYYGYLWSEVFSADMYESRFKKEGILNPTTGKSYRQEILLPGGSRDASESLRAFLGRDPTNDAFLRAKGLSA